MSQNWLIQNALLINEGQRWHGDLRIREGRIDTIGGALDARSDEKVLDANGRLLMPGMIDDQVHFREPGLEHKGELATESRAAVAGGITSFMEMPNTNPPAVDRANLESKFARASQRSLGNYSFYLGATNDNLDEIARLDPKSACGIKVFMGASTGNMLVDSPQTLDAIFAKAPVPVITHCEDTPIIERNLAAAMQRWGDAVPVSEHPNIRSREACIKSTRLALELARRHGTRLHVLHISTADELALFEPGPITGKRITAETCVHFLWFDADDYATRGNLIKCNPAIKTAADREAILAAVLDDRIDVIATDHAPHTREEKAASYLKAPSGLPLVQHALPVLLELHQQGELSLETMVHKVAHAPALLFNVRDRGFLREGYWADLTLVDLDRPLLVRDEDALAKCGWSPFAGETFRSSIAGTWVNGHRAWDGSRIIEGPMGQRLEFDR